MTSHDVVAIARRQLGIRAIGHTGTLDPFATGLLVLVVGAATRLARFVSGRAKTYRAEARLGFATSTDDFTGEPLGEPWSGSWPSESAVVGALENLVGTVRQRPPNFSAKLVDGVRSYRLARQGAAVALAEVEVTIASLRLRSYRPPLVEFDADVGAGTYLRSIARDLGQGLGVGAHLTGLRRERVGGFAVSDAVPLDQVAPGIAMVPVLQLVDDLPRVEVSPGEVVAVRHGRPIGTAEGEAPVALVEGGDLIAIAEPKAGRWQPVVVLNGAG